MVLGENILRGINGLSGIVGPVGAIAVERVVPERIIRVVRLLADSPVHVTAGINEIEIADLALHRQRGLPPAVMHEFRIEMRDCKITDAGVSGGYAIGLLILQDD